MADVKHLQGSQERTVISSPPQQTVGLHHFPDNFRHNATLRDVWTVVAHTDGESLERLEAPWRKHSGSDVSPFQTFSWNRAWYRNFSSEEQAPLVLELRKNGEPVAILPCYRYRREIRLAGDEICDYQDIVIDSGVTVAFALTQFMDWLRRESPESHFHFRKLSSEGRLYQALVEADVPPKRSIVFSKFFAPCPVVRVAGGLEAYLSSLPRKTRQDFRRSIKRLGKEAPGAQADIARDAEISGRQLDDAARFHIEHFRKDGESPLADARHLAMLKDVSRDPGVGLQLAWLNDREERLAVDFGFARSGRYFGYLTAFDPACQRLAPGKCLLLQRIDRWAEDDGVEVLDFLSGDESYKTGFTNGDGYHVSSVRLMPDHLPHRLLLLAFETDKQMRRIAKWALQKAGLRK